MSREHLAMAKAARKATGRSKPEFFTFITLVRYYRGKTPRDLNKFFEMKRAELERKDSRVKIVLRTVTFGCADSVIVWLAKDASSAKKFRDALPKGIARYESLVGFMCDSCEIGWP